MPVATRIAAILSILFALWGLAFVATPIGAVGGAAAAAFGLAFGALALHGRPHGRWRTTALAGVSVSVLALAVFAVVVSSIVWE
ncbi:MAG TPA: hypothetical protein VE596_01440 [Gaiellaceae bacterium]|jgi:hypothetical protein|nr:hypothetical protein [Gaiellaceae bacterium]